MLFTDEIAKGSIVVNFDIENYIRFDSERSVFNIININEGFRSNLYYVINNLMFCVFFYNQRGTIFKFAFLIAVQKLIYKTGMFIGLYDYHKGYSDILSLTVMVTFMIFNKIKWRFPLNTF